MSTKQNTTKTAGSEPDNSQIKDGIAYTESPLYGVKHIRGNEWHKPISNRKRLKDAIRRLNNKGVDITYHYAYGNPRCTTKDESRDLSPRLPLREMVAWLEGYETAIDEKTLA